MKISVPKAIAAFAVLVVCPCSVRTLMLGDKLGNDIRCPACGRIYDIEVINRMRKAYTLNGGK